jgi:hypothetical protein
MGGAASEQLTRRKRRIGATHHHDQLEIDGRWLVGGDISTQQPTAESNREGIDRDCVVNWRGNSCKHTTISQKRVIEVDAHCVVLFER